MFSPLAFTISFALLGSLILSLTLVPMLCTFFLKQVPHEHDPFHIRWLKHVYLVLLKPCVRHPWLVVIPAVLALAGAFALVPRIGTEFLPTLDEGSVAVKRSACPSISLPQSLELQAAAERILKQFPEVIDVVSRTGRADIASDPRAWKSATSSSRSSRARNGPRRKRRRNSWTRCARPSRNARRGLELLPADCAARGRTGQRREVRHRHQDFRRRPRRAETERRSRGARARQGARRGGHQRGESQRPGLPANRNRPRQDRALRHQRRRHSGSRRDGHRRQGSDQNL